MAEAPKRTPRLLRVKRAGHISPNMIRVTFGGPELTGFPVGREGGNCKIQFPEARQSFESFRDQVYAGLNKPITRTYTVRHYREVEQEMDVDFVDHGDGGPASAWARVAKPGDFINFYGPSPNKVEHFEADFYICAADMSAIPVVAATLEKMPRDAKGIAVFEVLDAADKIDINAPKGIEQRWIVNANPHKESLAQVDLIKGLSWPNGRVQTCIAGETATIRAFKQFIEVEKTLPRKDVYISGYWKLGLIEDEHQAMKRQENLAGA